jgi:hypothetical protein
MLKTSRVVRILTGLQAIRNPQLPQSRRLGNFDYLAVSVHLPREAGNKTDREKDGEGVSEEVSRIPAIPTLWSDPEAVDSRNGQGDGTE